VKTPATRERLPSRICGDEFWTGDPNKSRRDPNSDRGNKPMVTSSRHATAPEEGKMFSQTAPWMHTWTFAQLDPGMVGLAGVGVCFFLLVGVMPLAWVIGSAWAGVIKLRLKAELKQQVIALKQQMIERGMTADEIVQVLGPPSEALDDISEKEDDEAEEENDEAGLVNGPCVGEVVFEKYGGWHTALVLRRDGDRYLIHTCPGYGGRVEMSGNEWVKADRLRFAASSSGQDGWPQGSADRTGAFDASSCCSRPKKEPVPAEV
jgi:hypothetical protein